MLYSSEAALMGDSDFPTYATIKMNQGAQRYLIIKFFEEYSRLGFSRYQDRHVAISGLEQRLTKAFKDVSGAGVFKKWQYRCLLWIRANDAAKLSRIDFNKTRKGQDDSKSPNKVKPRSPPSWSWMAYEGSINYLEPPDAELKWNTSMIMRLTGTPDISWIYAKEDLLLKAEISGFETDSSAGQHDVDLVYDDPTAQGGSLSPPESGSSKKFVGECITIGTLSMRHYVLIVRPKVGQATYERIGAGYLPVRFIKPGHPNAEKFVIE
jgi:hypothetical protein